MNDVNELYYKAYKNLKKEIDEKIEPWVLRLTEIMMLAKIEKIIINKNNYETEIIYNNEDQKRIDFIKFVIYSIYEKYNDIINNKSAVSMNEFIIRYGNRR